MKCLLGFGKTGYRKICFIHIPRCGGTSLKSAIRNTYGIRQRLTRRSFLTLDAPASRKAARILSKNLLDYREELLIYFLSNTRFSFVAGHFPCSDIVMQQFGDEWHFVTVLRQPVDRWFSQYFYNRYKENDHFKTNLSLEEYLDSDVGISSGSIYTMFLASGVSTLNYRSKEAISEAIENLKKYSVVGILENLDLFTRDFQKVFGVRLKMEARNRNPLPLEKRQTLITKEIRERVEEICRPDLEVYEYVLKQIA